MVVLLSHILSFSPRQSVKVLALLGDNYRCSRALTTGVNFIKLFEYEWLFSATLNNSNTCDSVVFKVGLVFIGQC